MRNRGIPIRLPSRRETVGFRSQTLRRPGREAGTTESSNRQATSVYASWIVRSMERTSSVKRVRVGAFVILAGLALASASGAAPVAQDRDTATCKQEAKQEGDFGTPIRSATRTGVAVLIIDQRHNHVVDCVFLSPKYWTSSGGFLTSFEVPRPNSIAYDGSACRKTNATPPFTNTFGRMGADITGATFEFAHRKAVQGIVLRGFYSAWWYSPDYPNRIVLTTRSRRTVNVRVPPSLSRSGPCPDLGSLGL